MVKWVVAIEPFMEDFFETSLKMLDVKKILLTFLCKWRNYYLASEHNITLKNLCKNLLSFTN